MTQSLLDLQLPLFLAAQYGVVSCLLATAWVVGRSLLDRLEPDSEFEATVVGIALGMGLVGTPLFVMALGGVFRPLPILVLASACHLVFRRRWIEAAAAIRRWATKKRPTGHVALVGAALLLLAPLLYVALYPPTQFDALMFHLPLADSIVSEGRINFFADLRFPVFPALQEVLYASVYLFSNDIAPSLVHFACYLLVAAVLFCWGSWLSSRRTGIIAALLWLGVPAALNTAIGAYVDCGLTLYVTTAIFCLHRYVRRDQTGWLVVAGALLAFGAATKYHGLYFLVLLSVAVAARSLWHRRGRALLAYAGAAVSLTLPWYGFIYYHTGNPIFPFFPHIFGLSHWAFELRNNAQTSLPEIDGGGFAGLAKVARLFRALWFEVSMLLDRNPLDLLRLPIDIFDPEHRFRGDRLSPLLAGVVPLIGVMLFRFRRARYLMLIACSYLVIWAVTAKDTRYLLVVVPLFALSGAEAVDRSITWLADRSWPALRPLLAAAVVLPLLLQVSQMASRIVWANGRPPVSSEEREAYYLDQLKPYAAIRALNEQFDSDYTVYALFCENLKHLSRGRHLGDWFGPHRYARLSSILNDSEALHRELDQMGVDHLLLPDLSVWKRYLERHFQLPSGEQLGAHFELFYRDRFTRVYRLLPREEMARHRDEALDRTDEPGAEGGRTAVKGLNENG